MDLKLRTTTQHNPTSPSTSQEIFLGVAAARVNRVTETLAHAGSSIVLSGEPGCGKAYVAQAAAHAIERQLTEPIQRVIIDDVDSFSSLYAGVPSRSPSIASARILDSLRSRTPGRELLIIAFNIDRYGAGESAVLEHLVRDREVRFIGTAHQIVGAADRLARDPGVQQLAVEPLSLEETDKFLSGLLGVESFGPRPLSRWHAATRGNQHALLTLALSADRRGVVQRVRKVGWVSYRDEHAPEDFVTQLGELTPLERTALEFVSYAAPLHEPSLMQLLDADAVTSLMRRQILTVRTGEDGVNALTTRLPVVADSVRTHMCPVHRMALAKACFQALLAEDTTLTSAERLRLVKFGIDSGSEVPVDWVWQAIRALARSGDLRLQLRLALAAMPLEDPQRAAEAILKACDLAHFLDDRNALDEAMSALDKLLQDPQRFDTLPYPMQFPLAVSSICFDSAYLGMPELALSALDDWERRWQAKGFDAAGATQACRMRVLALNGRVNDALMAGSRSGGPRNLHEEWLAAPARTFEALLRIQRGEFRRALTLAEATRQIIMLQDISPTLSGDLEGFALFLAHWARGTTISARHTIEMLTTPSRQDLTAVHTTSGFVEMCIVLFALQEARWHDAIDITERLLVAFSRNDPFGVAPLAHAASALAFAALGEETSAIEELQRSEYRMPGISEALQGFLGSLTLQARHWLRDPDLIRHARELAEWARSQDLPLIELKALDVIAHEIAAPDHELLSRATNLAGLVDPPVGDAILAHIRALTKVRTPGGADPEERLLSELGIWLPLPPVEELTGREREIALFTALGYSSKHIAERLHLSARTIETHLAHVYGKLGVNGREELRRWFSHRREAA